MSAKIPRSREEEVLHGVYRFSALYYLGVLHTMDGDHPLAQACFERVIQIDPASNFGKKTYLQLGKSQ
jgi:hypothetical protein